MEKVTILPASMVHVVRHAAGDFLPEITAEIEQGKAELIRIDECFFVLRLETYSNHKELCVVCAEGQQLAKHCRLIIEKAKQAGCKNIRFHTANHKLGRAMRRFNAVEAERVYTIGL